MCRRAPAGYLPLDFVHSQVDIQGCGTFFLASTVAGYLRKKLTLVELLLFFSVTILFIAPGTLSGLSGVALNGALVVWHTVILKLGKTNRLSHKHIATEEREYLYVNFQSCPGRTL